jgi:hypothetical protein
MQMMPVKINNQNFKFSQGSIISFRKRLLKNLHPDLHQIQNVYMLGILQKKILEINEMTKDVIAGNIFVTAFLDFGTYKKFADSLAWDTEV